MPISIFGKQEIDLNEEKQINQMKLLAIDMIDNAKSGHPGIVLSSGEILYQLYANHLRILPKNPTFFNRDRFVLSCGHASSLLYSCLFMAGYDITLDDLKKFRQIDSITPGHPELNVTPGVDMTTGPLGQGIATSVGMAIAEKYLHEKFNPVDFNIYCLVSDGDMMEGISYEAMSLAGHLKLDNLIVLYDSNNMSLDGKLGLSYSDNMELRCNASKWKYYCVEDITTLNSAIEQAKSINQPVLIEVKTILGRGSKLENTNTVHGKPLEKDDISQLKEKFGLRDVPFSISQDTIEQFRDKINNRVKGIEEEFNTKVNNLKEKDKEILNKIINKDYKLNIDNFIYDMPNEEKESPRDTSYKIINYASDNNINILGGSADLFSSCKNYIENGGVFYKDDYTGKNIYFGIREHLMGAILNGISLCGLTSYGSTFLSFSDYMVEPIRLSAMMNLKTIYIFTHDSISVGEDGPTHEPIEQLSKLRITPNVDVFRPCDVNEVIGSYKTILEKENGPSVLCLSRNKLPILSTSKANDVIYGGYTLLDYPSNIRGILISSGEEVHLALDVAKKLQVKGINLRVVSMPNLKRFLNQDDEYIDSVLPVEIRKIVIEAGVKDLWNCLVYNTKNIISIDTFGASGKKEDVYEKYGFDIETLSEKIEKLLK